MGKRSLWELVVTACTLPEFGSNLCCQGGPGILTLRHSHSRNPRLITRGDWQSKQNPTGRTHPGSRLCSKLKIHEETITSVCQWIWLRILENVLDRNYFKYMLKMIKDKEVTKTQEKIWWKYNGHKKWKIKVPKLKHNNYRKQQMYTTQEKK